MKYLFIVISIVLLVFVSGCASRGQFNGQNTNTLVNVKNNNFKVIKTNVVGASSGFNFLGFIPFASPAYYEAKKDLFKNAGENFAGRSIALINQTEDRSVIYLILFSITTLTLSADIIEYQDTSVQEDVTIQEDNID
jgi:hypothetical protein